MKTKPDGYWQNIETCKLDALKYISKKEWRRKSSGAYDSAHTNGWIDECCEHMIILGNKFKRLIYVFIFSDKFIYVGLTGNPERRKLEHLNKGSVFSHFKKTKLTPEFKILSEYVDVDEAIKLEKEYQNLYLAKGYYPLFKAKAGSLGGNKKYWILERCKSDALKYKTRKEWQIKSRAAYNSAFNNRWLEECCSHMIRLLKPKGYWTLEKCKEDAINFTTKKEWEINSKLTYHAAHRNNWISLCCGHMKNGRKNLK